MKEPEIIDLALNNISPLLNHRGKWEKHDHSELDGFVILEFPDGMLKFPTEVKYEVRAHLLGTLKEMKDEHPDFLLVAYRIYYFKVDGMV